MSLVNDNQINVNELNMVESSKQDINSDLDETDVSIQESESFSCENSSSSTLDDNEDNSNETLTANFDELNLQNDNNNSNVNNNGNTIQIPIVGYEVMEERAKFTVYKLRVENKSTGDCWYVFRRYTDFVRLCSRLKKLYPRLAVLMPRKKYFGNNFDPVFLETRIHGLQTFVNAIISVPDLIEHQQIQDFFCLNEPPAYSDTTEESRAIFEALEDTIYQLRHQLREKEAIVQNLRTQTSQYEHLKLFLRNSTKNCQKCSKDYENYRRTINTNRTLNEQNENETFSLCSSTSSNKK